MEVVVNSENFESEVLNSDVPVLVDFWATWCGPCKMIAPHVAKIAEQYANQVKVCKIDVDQAGDVAQNFNVSSIPTLLFFKNGDIVASHVGAASYQMLDTFVKENL